MNIGFPIESENTKGSRKRHAEKQKIERATSLPPSGSLCGLNEAVDLLKISSPDSLSKKSSVDNKKGSEQLFSLIPELVPFPFLLIFLKNLFCFM